MFSVACMIRDSGGSILLSVGVRGVGAGLQVLMGIRINGDRGREQVVRGGAPETFIELRPTSWKRPA